ncbi:MAG: hypothetical protein HYT08_03775 [Candidatus Levybacteria bacterium]|nr:hypothetical protein [Candidatus Levybacteria bacterium]
MRYTVTAKQCELSDKALLHIKNHVRKLAGLLPEFRVDLPLLEIIIKRHKKRRLNHITDEVRIDNVIEIVESVTPKSEDPIYYDGTIKLILPKKPLVVYTRGFLLDQVIDVGFHRLTKEIKTYKGKHFVGNSEYFDRRSIRTGDYFINSTEK